jgi:CheY-like chemotaxis protein
MDTLLLVEDDDDLRVVTQLTLEQRGYHVLAAANGCDALHIAREHPGPIHLLVTDLVMPELDGAEPGRQVGSVRLGIGILYVTAFAVAQLVDQAIVLNHIVLDPGVPILTKPFTPEGLAEAIRMVLDKPCQRFGPDGPQGRTEGP